jgi:Protein of unknown function (DUF4232)
MPPIAPRPRGPIGYLAALVVVAVLVGPAAGASAAPSNSTTTSTTTKTSLECNATQLTFAVTGFFSRVHNEESFSMSVTNVSARACRIHGYPTVRFYTSAGRLLTFGNEHSSVMFHHTSPRVLDLAPNDNAYFEVAYGVCDNGIRDVASQFHVLAPFTTGAPWVGHVRSPSTGVRPVDYCAGTSRQYLAISPLVASLSQLAN